MALAQLQGLTPLGGSSGGGYGPRSPSGDGTDPNDPNNQQNQQRRPQNTGAPSSSQGSSQGNVIAPQTQTFAQMQAQGQARPAPPPPPQQQGQSQGQYQGQGQYQQQGPQSPLANQTSQAASQALANPSAYGAPQVQQSMNVLNQGLATQALLGRRQIDETMASRGLYDSTAAGDKYGQLQAQQDQARAGYATQLATQAAQTYGADRSAAIQNASNVQNQQFGQGLSQQQQNLNAALGYGQLGVSQGALTGNYNGESTLGAQQLAQQGSQFQQNLGLQSGLGYGSLGVQQGQLNLAQLAQQQNYGIAQQGLNQQQAYQSGQLGLGQSQINASLLNEQRQSIGNLAYAGAMQGTAPSQDWINFLMSNQGQSNNQLYNLPGSGGGGQAPGQYPGGSGPVHFPGAGTPTFSTGQGGQGNLPMTGNQQTILQSLGYNTPTYANSLASPGQQFGGQQQQQQSGSSAFGQDATGANMPQPGEQPWQTYGRNTGYNPQTGSGPLAVGTSGHGTDPMSLYAQGKMDYGTMQGMVNQQNAQSGSYSLTGGNSANLSDQQIQQTLTGQYQGLLSANHGNAQAAYQALTNGAGGSLDPRAMQLLSAMGYGGH